MKRLKRIRQVFTRTDVRLAIGRTQRPLDRLLAREGRRNDRAAASRDPLAPYEPAIVDLPDAGLREFVLADRMTFSRPAGNYDELVDSATGKVIGFAWPIGIRPEITEASTSTAAAVEQPATAKPSDLREQGESGAPQDSDDERIKGEAEVERVEIAPGQFVNAASARKLGLIT